MARDRKINVVPERPESYFDGAVASGEVIAEHIAAISDGMQRLMAGPLKRETIVLLIQNKTRINRRNIERVLDALGQLKKDYLREDHGKKDERNPGK